MSKKIRLDVLLTDKGLQESRQKAQATIMSGLDTVYMAQGDTARPNIPLGYSDGEGEIRVMFYSDGTLLNCCTVGDDGLSWS